MEKLKHVESISEQEKSEQREKTYLEGRRHCCVFCRSFKLNKGAFESHGIGVFCTVSCHDCNGVWSELYELLGVREIMHGGCTS